jgi:hypothetical protein
MAKPGEEAKAAAAAREAVNHPDHYQAEGDPGRVYEVIRVVRAWRLGFSLGNAVKYVARAGKKDPAKAAEDLKKAVWYINEEIAHIEGRNV